MNLNFLMSWINVLIKPKETFEKEKANASFLKGFVNLVTAAIIFVFLSGFFYFEQAGQRQSNNKRPVLFVNLIHKPFDYNYHNHQFFPGAHATLCRNSINCSIIHSLLCSLKQ